jgi:hypothetical protein
MAWLLSKFMIALDIHFYMKNGSIKMACDSIYAFLDAFAKYLNNIEKSKLIQTALYLIMVSKFGSCYLPDYALEFFDITYDLNGLHYNHSLLGDVLLTRHNHADIDGFENEV